MNIVRKILIVALVLSLALPSASLAAVPAAAPAAAAASTVNFTILHTNDFHGNLEPVPASSYPGMARVATMVNSFRTALGAENVLLLDAGDSMQGSLLSNLNRGVPTVEVFNHMGYAVSTLGNHEFDWGQGPLADRAVQADYPFLAANVVVNDTGNCATAGWETPSFSIPWTTATVGSGENAVTVGLIGVTSIETPYITIAAATEGLCFKDPAASILHHYDELAAASDFIVAMTHLGLADGGYGYGLTVYGDRTLAGLLNTAGKPVNLIIGGHSHTNMAAAEQVGSTYIVQAHSAGRRVGKADVTLDTETGAATIAWTSNLVPMGSAQDPDVQAIIESYSLDPEYLALVNEVIGYTAIDLIRDYNGDLTQGTGTMGSFIQDAIYNDLNEDDNPDNDADMVFNNPGGMRIDIPIGDTSPYTLTYGLLYSVLPFGNQTIVGDMTGAQIVELLNQSATLFRGALSPGGIRYKYYRYGDASTYWAWGAFDIEVRNKETGLFEPIDLDRTYRVATNEFLAPAGQDGFVPFKYMTNISYYGDMLNGVIRWVEANYTYDNPYDEPYDMRIERLGDNTGGPVVPVTVLHNNDSHGYLDNYAKLATFIKQRRDLNPTRTLLLNAGDQIQGDSMAYYFKSAALGYAADGTPLTGTLATNPIIAVMNALEYDAMTVGNHEYNFGSAVFTSTLGQADFAILQANVTDTGEYGIDTVPVEASTTFSLGAEGIDVAVLGIGNHRVPSYELPSNIAGLSFSNPIETAQALAPDLQAQNDMVIALTHIGFTGDPNSVEVDENVDTVLAAETPGVDVVIGGHSHTNPKTGYGPYKWLPTFIAGPDNTPVIVSQAARRNTFLGEIVVGFLPDGENSYRPAAKTGRYHEVVSATAIDPTIDALIQPYKDRLAAYNNTVLGSTAVPIDTLKAFTEETNGANLQADASVFELARNGIEVDVHLSGAMTNAAVALSATSEVPYELKVSDMFSLMPYENSLVVLEMNGPQLKRVLERAYRNYYYYKYVPGRGGYSYYTTCMLATNSMGQIVYRDTYPMLPSGDNVEALLVGGEPVDFSDAETFYRVSTVNYLAAGACNFSDSGQTLWPLDQIVNDTQFYVRDAVINYIDAQVEVIAPAVEGRLVFLQGVHQPITSAGGSLVIEDEGRVITLTLPAGAVTEDVTIIVTPLDRPTYPGPFVYAGLAFNAEAYDSEGHILPGFTFELPVWVEIQYTDENIIGLIETELRLYFWNGEAWEDAACTPYERDLEGNKLSFGVCHLTAFAMFAIGYDVSLTTPMAQKSGVAGDVVEYEVMLTNVGDVEDTYTFTYSSTWEYDGPAGPVNLGAGESITFTVSVTIPDDALVGESDVLSLTATSEAEPLVMDQLDLTTTVVEPVVDFSLTADVTSQTTGPDATVTYTFTLANLGNVTDTYTVTLTGTPWGALVGELHVTLGAGGSVVYTLNVVVPADAAAGTYHSVVTVASHTEPEMVKTLEFHTMVEVEVVQQYNLYLPLLLREAFLTGD